MSAYSYNFTVNRYVTFLSQKITIRVNGTPLDLTGASILCQFRKAPLKPVILEWRVGSGISIESPETNGTFFFDEQVFTIPAGQYSYDVHITLASGVMVKYLYGILTVQDVISIPA